MREIKFRFYRKEPKGEMLYFSLENFIFNEKNVQPLIDYSWVRNNAMQYIGLKDKNGKEIYEGDILKGTGPSFYIIVDDYHGYRFKTKFTGEKYIDNNNADNLTRADALHNKIIGNIYENPELCAK